MTRGVPVLDPKVHLKGATPEKLARALFRRVEPKKTADACAPAEESATAKAAAPAGLGPADVLDES